MIMTKRKPASVGEILEEFLGPLGLTQARCCRRHGRAGRRQAGGDGRQVLGRGRRHGQGLRDDDGRPPADEGLGGVGLDDGGVRDADAGAYAGQGRAETAPELTIL